MLQSLPQQIDNKCKCKQGCQCIIDDDDDIDEDDVLDNDARRSSLRLMPITMMIMMIQRLALFFKRLKIKPVI